VTAPIALRTTVTVTVDGIMAMATSTDVNEAVTAVRLAEHTGINSQ